MYFDVEIWIVAVLCVAYFTAGFVDSIAGGGGLISIPVFLLTGIAPELVLGTNKMVVSAGTASSLATYAKQGYVIWKMALAGIPAAILGGCLGSKTVLLLNSAQIGKIVVFLMPLGILATLVPKKESRRPRELTNRAIYFYSPIICFLLGIYDGFFGPGTGSFFILFFHCILGMDLIYASATAKIFNLTTGVGSLIVFALHGKVLYTLAIPLAVSNIAGNIIGSKLAMKIGAPFVTKILVISLTMLLASLTWKFIIFSEA
jgi:uncharacterized membrane protein YfcA